MTVKATASNCSMRRGMYVLTYLRTLGCCAFRCAKDKFLLSNLDYVSDLQAGKEAHVYKYADRQSMFFDCQITLTIKEPGQQYCDVS